MKTTITIPYPTTDDQVEYFTWKFYAKMHNTVPSTAAWWVDGIGELGNQDKLRIWKNIQFMLDNESPDPGAQSDDWPDFVILGDIIDGKK